MIQNAATPQEGDDEDDDGDRTAQRVLVANGATLGASLLGSPLIPLSENRYRNWEPPQGPVF